MSFNLNWIGKTGGNDFGATSSSGEVKPAAVWDDTKIWHEAPTNTWGDPYQVQRDAPYKVK